jgi:hypothetical protein
MMRHLQPVARRVVVIVNTIAIHLAVVAGQLFDRIGRRSLQLLLRQIRLELR